MRGLDPRIHDEMQLAKGVTAVGVSCLMDCRIKPGNDGPKDRARDLHSPFVPAEAGTQCDKGDR
jgi:hypothetical protein